MENATVQEPFTPSTRAGDLRRESIIMRALAGLCLLGFALIIIG